MSAQPGFLENVGPMGDFYRAKDWSTCPLGAPDTWTEALRGYVDMCVRLPTPAIIFWGPEQIQLYNLGYSEIMGPRHPKYLGAPYRECWPDTFSTIYPMMRRVLDHGEVIQVTDALIPVTRYGFTEETYFTFSFVPLRGAGGAIEGFIQPINEVTRTLLAERRLATLRALSPRVTGTRDAVSEAVDAFRANPQDIPFAAIFARARQQGAEAPPERFELAAAVGISSADASALDTLAREVLGDGTPRTLEVERVFGAAHFGPWPERARLAMALPLRRSASDDVLGVVILGISSRLAFNDTYQAFFESAARELASNIAFERENRERERLARELQKRADALMELDRAKTAFFSNVSHEFRTPLTLMLGPLEDALGDRAEPLGAHQRERIGLVQRNGGRLLKLVNTLLDFSRIEAGRTKARFEPTDLAQATTDLASTFRSLIEREGLTLVVDCPPLAEPVWVDREMWEKIVLNLLSNAFKFTMSGEITVRLAAKGDAVELSVRDTGSGIPESELPKLFERFHRVEGAKGRSFEGSGIGLALVQELVRLHGGDIRVASKLGEGTTFTVSIRTGTAHIDEDQKHAPRGAKATSAAAQSFLHEAQAWSHEHEHEHEHREERARAEADPVTLEALPTGRVVLADDNPDMRTYIRNLLEPRMHVEAVSNGLDALAAVRARRPDLVLTDVMMPGLDGFGLLRELKSHEATRSIPVILLSARAGEEARVEGMDAGADDYLVKPFAARELIARVAARLEIARMQARINADLERRVEERTIELREANRELESFSYSVSHDLRAPLRHILGFAQLMERGSKGTLDPKLQSHLTRISDAARRGGQLVDDLLAFSRMGRAEMRERDVDLAQVVQEVRAELVPDQQGRRVEWRVDPLPVVQADAALVRLVFKNLLANALKYTRTRGDARIEIGCREEMRELEVWVRDNGVGFDMRYVDKLFGVFQRLHSENEFEGTGIGLALVRRVISRHGGRTWAEGAVGEGATIHFTLPRGAKRSSGAHPRA